MGAWLERALVLLATLATIAVNALANTRGINDVSTGEVAGRYDLPFTPSGYVFSIWGLIYVGLIAFSVHQLAGAGLRSPRLQRIRPAYVFASVANMAWLWFWHHEALTATLAIMLMLWASLAWIYRALAADEPATPLEAGSVDAVFSLYFGWITVATLANLSVVMTSVAGPWPIPDPATWAQAMVLASLGIALYAYRRLKDPVFLAVIAWAAAGIALKGAQAPAVALPAMVVAGLSGLGAIGLLLARGPGDQPVTG
jgi:hypothetical protein